MDGERAPVRAVLLQPPAYLQPGLPYWLPPPTPPPETLSGETPDTPPETLSAETPDTPPPETLSGETRRRPRRSQVRHAAHTAARDALR